MTWSYRILKRKTETGDAYYALHEVYYDDKHKAWGCTQDPKRIIGDTPKEVRKILQMMLKDASLPVMDYDKIPEEGAKEE
jgi:hypothetical protein